MFSNPFSKKPSAANAQALSEEELRKLDVIVLVDHSGSMASRSNRTAGNRLHEVEKNVLETAQVAEKYDDDGLTVIAFSGHARVFDGVGSLKVGSVFKEFQPDGSTNLAEALREASKKAASSKKEVVVLVYTDGIPDNEEAARAEIESAGRLGRPKIGFTFIQVGDDAGAAKFLDRLDNGMKVDVVATVRAADAEKLSFAQLAWLARNA